MNYVLFESAGKREEEKNEFKQINKRFLQFDSWKYFNVKRYKLKTLFV